jgi:hypothetical protein
MLAILTHTQEIDEINGVLNEIPVVADERREVVHCEQVFWASE